MKKKTISYRGADYIVRTLDVRSLPGFDGEGYAEVNVAGESLWNSMDQAVYAGEKEASGIDSQMFFYIPDEMLERDATDEEIVKFLRSCMA